MSNAPTHQATVYVMPHQYDTFLKTVVRLNKKALKYELPAIEVEAPVLADYYVQRTDEVNHNGTVSHYVTRPVTANTPPELARVQVMEIDITYPIVQKGNWRVVGLIEPIEDATGANMVSLFGVDDPELSKTLTKTHGCKEIDCAHCETKRKRNQGFLLLDQETNDILEVGSTCVEDYTGIDPKSALFLADLHQVIKNYDSDVSYDGMPQGQKIQLGSATLNLLADGLFIIDNFGYLSNAKAAETGEPSTADMMEQLSELLKSENLRDNREAHRESRLERAQAIIDWSQTLEETNSYQINLKNILSAEVIYQKHHKAFALSAITAYDREMTARREREANPSVHFGQPKERMMKILSLETAQSFPSKFGVAWRINCKDEQGNKVSWMTGSPPEALTSMENKFKTFTAEFTVKDHDVFRGEPITHVTRLDMLGWGNVIDEVMAERNAPNRNVPYFTFRINRCYGSALYGNGIHSEVALALKHIADDFGQAIWENPKEVVSQTLSDSLGDDGFATWTVGMAKEKTLKNQFTNDCFEILIMGDPKNKAAFFDTVAEQLSTTFYELFGKVKAEDVSAHQAVRHTANGHQVRLNIPNDYLLERQLDIRRELAQKEAAPSDECDMLP